MLLVKKGEEVPGCRPIGELANSLIRQGEGRKKERKKGHGPTQNTTEDRIILQADDARRGWRVEDSA
jgi:hypothetical protein